MRAGPHYSSTILIFRSTQVGQNIFWSTCVVYFILYLRLLVRLYLFRFLCGLSCRSPNVTAFIVCILSLRQSCAHLFMYVGFIGCVVLKNSHGNAVTRLCASQANVGKT